jgi:hypothetical protein
VAAPVCDSLLMGGEHADSADNSEHSPTKTTSEHVEQIHTNERVPGHSNYYEKDGLRTYGDGEDHDHEPPMNFKRMMALIAMAFCKSLSPG